MKVDTQGFAECLTCADIPGSPVPCVSCQVNRSVIHELRADLKRARDRNHVDDLAPKSERHYESKCAEDARIAEGKVDEAESAGRALMDIGVTGIGAHGSYPNPAPALAAVDLINSLRIRNAALIREADPGALEIAERAVSVLAELDTSSGDGHTLLIELSLSAAHVDTLIKENLELKGRLEKLE